METKKEKLEKDIRMSELFLQINRLKLENLELLEKIGILEGKADKKE